VICAPSFAKALYEQHGITVTCLDIDKRFDYLPGFQYFDLNDPHPIEGKTFELIFMDPPFFSVNLDLMCIALGVLARGDFLTKIMLSYPWREEKLLKTVFRKFSGFERTNFEVEYATVEQIRWDNYGWYTNCDMPMMKRLKTKKGKK
jgi:hypothetical protein